MLFWLPEGDKLHYQYIRIFLGLNDPSLVHSNISAVSNLFSSIYKLIRVLISSHFNPIFYLNWLYIPIQKCLKEHKSNLHALQIQPDGYYL